jgi:hypothetical protein
MISSTGASPSGCPRYQNQSFCNVVVSKVSKHAKKFPNINNLKKNNLNELIKLNTMISSTGASPSGCPRYQNQSCCNVVVSKVSKNAKYK